MDQKDLGVWKDQGGLEGSKGPGELRGTRRNIRVLKDHEDYGGLEGPG